MGGVGDVGVVSSGTELVERVGRAVLGEAGWGGVMEAVPWLFSERDVLDLMRLKKPLFLDSRFLSAASCILEGGALTEESLEKSQEKKKEKKKKKHLFKFTSQQHIKGFPSQKASDYCTSLLIKQIFYLT